MIQPIMTSPIILAMPSAPATAADLPIAQDLLDTLTAHANECVGMAANMIGVRKRIIAFDNEGTYEVMLNPEFVKASGEFETEEGCLSLSGVRHTKRFKRITVRYQDLQLQPHEKTYSGWTAQIIQHEIDHCNGILI